MVISIAGAEQSGAHQSVLGSCKPSGAYQSALKQLAVSDSRTTRGAQELLNALWRSPDRSHQIGEMNRANRRFHNVPVKSVDEAVDRAIKLSNDGDDAYFACAEYVTPNSRTADNASGAYGFWVDIDCGEGKHAAGKGYKTSDDALLALSQFCCDSGLPEATHIVDSGSGLHVYWVMDQVVECNQWRGHAVKLKSLTKELALLADDSRTADIVSVLRVPGTLNYKYEPPKPVSLRFAAMKFIGQSAMLDAIDAAYDRFCGTERIKVPSPLVKAQVTVASDNVEKPQYRAIDIERLASALTVLDPDCDDYEWKLKRLAPLAKAARENPTSERTLRELARSWSSGELRGYPARAWGTPGGNGRTGEEVFDEVWARFLKGGYSGRPATVGTIYYDAAAAGWDNQFDSADRFEVIAQGDA